MNGFVYKNMKRKEYKRSIEKIEIDITYKCNLFCDNCDRSCNHRNNSEDMDIEQIKKFIKESIELNIEWKKIKILGGEPTLHPDIMDIMILLNDYVKKYNYNCKLVLVTNGYSKKTQRILKEIEPYCIIKNTKKEDKNQFFDSFNTSPIDTKEHSVNNYKMGCQILEICGIGLNMYGYYPCAVSGSIDTFINKDIGRKKLPDILDDMKDILNETCRYCGHFNNGGIFWDSDKWTTNEKVSETWKYLYNKGNNRLTRY